MTVQVSRRFQPLANATGISTAYIPRSPPRWQVEGSKCHKFSQTGSAGWDPSLQRQLADTSALHLQARDIHHKGNRHISGQRALIRFSNMCMARLTLSISPNAKTFSDSQAFRGCFNSQRQSRESDKDHPTGVGTHPYHMQEKPNIA